VSIVDDSFDARFSAVSRTYHYYLLLQPHNSVHLYRYVGWYHSNLDLKLMQDAAQLLLGKHDFSSFRASSCQANSPIRDMQELKIEGVGNMLRFSLTANAFLHHMVRNIVGALVYVGNGKINYSDFERIFKQANRNFAPPTFMPNGLYLADVEYPQFIENNFNPEVWLFNH
jgi:tRNA pseudouridine38-40 synthase